MATALGERFWSKVNKEAANGCWEWTASKRSGYGQFRIGEHVHRTHRLAWSELRGSIPEAMQLDHMCWNKACVNPEHLRLTTNAQNGQNLLRVRSNNTSGARGVAWRKDRQKWHATVTLHGLKRHVGYYLTVPEAEAAVMAWRRENMPYSLMDMAA